MFQETRIRATDKDLQSGVQSISITNRYGGEEVMHTLVAESHDDTQRWMQAFWQQFYDMSESALQTSVPSCFNVSTLTCCTGNVGNESCTKFHFFGEDHHR